MTAFEPIVRRYTNLPATLDILMNRRLTVLSPTTWDDRNDAFFLAEFKTRIGARSLLALCFSEAPETYHHWRVFSIGADGVCLWLNKEKLIKALTLDSRFSCGSVKYLTINRAESSGIRDSDLPFIKRHPYRDEREFRILLIDPDTHREFDDLKIPLDVISRVTLSPWMPKRLAETVKATLKSLDGCQKLRVYQSTLVENERWKRIANSDVV